VIITQVYEVVMVAPELHEQCQINIALIRSHYPDTRLEKEANSLQNSGYSVNLIVWDRGRILPNSSENNFNTVKLKLNAPLDSIIVVLYLPVWWLFVIYQLSKMKIRIVHAADLDSYFPALFFSKITNKRIIYDIYDFYADMIRFPVFPALCRKIFASVDRYLMNFSDVIIIADDSRKEQIGNAIVRPVLTIMNVPDLDEMNKEMDIGSHQVAKSQKFSIFFGGRIADERGILEMCQAVTDLQDVELTLMGPCSSAYRKELEKITNGSKNISTHFEWVPYTRILEQSLNADLLFALYDPTIINNKYASPNKLFESMICGKPILVNNGTSMAEIVNNANCGIVIPYGDVDAMRNAILLLKNDPNLVSNLGKNGRKAYELKYNWKIMETRLLDCYKGLFRTT
jgi:glycosyltransferase involved in cell wall biosynthesis